MSVYFWVQLGLIACSDYYDSWEQTNKQTNIVLVHVRARMCVGVGCGFGEGDWRSGWGYLLISEIYEILY